MKNLRNLLLSFGGLLLVLQLAFVSPVSAQGSKKLERQRLNRIIDSPANVEEFRQEYDDFLAEIEDALRLFDAIPAVRQKFASSGLRSVEQITIARQNLAAMKPDDLEKLREAYAKVPGWRDGSRALNSLIEPGLRQRIETEQALKKSGEVSSNAITPDECPDPKDVPSNTDIAAVKASEIAADTIMELLPTDALTIIVREIATGVRAGFKGGVLAAETLKAIAGDCSGAEFEAGITQQVTNSTNTIVNNDNANATTITTAISNAKTEIVNNDNSNKTAIINNDNTNTTNIVNNDNANKTAIINNDNANTVTITTAVANAKSEIIVNANTNKDELLRLQIAADLAAVDSATPVAVFMLPAVKGGYLELVRTIVVQAITDLAGSNAALANSFLAQGDAAKTAGDYKKAYALYRKAYKTATS